MNKQSGKVKWFNNAKGIGFIMREDKVEVFVHYKSILFDGHKTLRKGQDVTFKMIETEFGLQAADVALLDTV